MKSHEVSLAGVFGAMIAMTCLSTAVTLAHAESLQEPISGIELVRIGGACFERGAAAAGPVRDGYPFRVPALDEVPNHKVCVDDFWIGKTEVTRRQWLRVMDLPEPPESEGESPVAHLSWVDAQKFIEVLNRRVAGRNGMPKRFRLPGEAEWEYACHGGEYVPSVHLEGEDRSRHIDALLLIAWFGGNSGREPQPKRVGQKSKNAFGLHDMLGNVWEWTEDTYQAYESVGAGIRVKPSPAPGTGTGKVIRGGSYMSNSAHVRCGARNYNPESDRSPTIGFRVLAQ